MELVPIRAVADRFDLPISTLHFWERRGLVAPVRRGGQRWYDVRQLHRVALIQHWRETGTLSVEEIATMLAGRTATHDWRDTVADRIEAIGAQIEQLSAARSYLSELISCPREHALEECPDFRELVAARTPAT